MKKLIEQILKFGVVGVVCFLIDFLITMGLSTLLRSVAGMPTGSAALVGAFFWIYDICYCELSAVHEVCICPQRGHGQKKRIYHLHDTEPDRTCDQ